MNARTRLVALGCSAVCLLACGKDKAALTQVMVVIEAEPGVRAVARDVDVEVRSGEGSTRNWDVRLRQSLTPGSGAIRWPLEIGLVPRGGDADRVYMVTATARDAEGEAVAEVRAISGYRKGETVTLLLLFEDSCLDKVDLCNEQQTCRSGDCVDARVNVNRLPTYRRDDAGVPVGTPFWDAGAADAGDAQVGPGGSGGTGGSGGGGSGGTMGAECRRHSDCDDGDPCNGEERCEDDVCTAGECAPQTVEECEASQCGTPAGCDPEDGCIYVQEEAGTECDDGDPCTENDVCTGTDATCAGEPKDCDDGVACTDDSCDETGACVNETNDDNCSRACNVGTCHATLDCQYTAQPDFTACNDGDGATTPDFCYQAHCVGGTQGAPTASCAVGGCGCSGWLTVKDLAYMGSEYVGMIDATQTGGGLTCRDGDVASILYEVTPDALMPYTIDSLGGGRWEPGVSLIPGYALTSTTVGVVDPANNSVDWFDHSLETSLSSAALTNYGGMARIATGQIVGRTNHFFFWGDDPTTSTTGKVVRCSWTSCMVLPCTDPAPTCSVMASYTTRSVMGVSPYTQSSGLNSVYGGVVAAVNFDSGANTRAIYADGTSQDFVPTQLEIDHTEGVWLGTLLLPGVGQVLAYGRGATNLVRCDDAAADGDPTCIGISGLPNQANRAYFDGTVSSSGAVLLLASSCVGGGLCLSTSYYLVALPAGADPTVGTNWREYFLGSFSIAIGTRRSALAVAAGGETIMVLGLDDGAPYVWTWTR